MHAWYFIGDLFKALSVSICRPDVFKRLIFCVSNTAHVWIAKFCCLCSLLARILKFSDVCSFTSVKDPAENCFRPTGLPSFGSGWVTSPELRGHPQGLCHGSNVVNPYNGDARLGASAGHSRRSPDSCQGIRLVQHSTDEAFAGWTHQ